MMLFKKGEDVKKRYVLSLIAGAMIMLLAGGCGGKRQNAVLENTQQEVETADSQQKAETGQQQEVEAEPQKEAEGENSGQETVQSAGISFDGKDIEGNSVSESVLSGSKLTMINVWATYCNPCLREMPDLGELAGAYGPQDFQIIGIISDVQEGADEAAVGYAAGLIDQTGADYTHLLLNRSIYDALLTNVSAVPTTFFLNENGEVLDTVIGAMNKSAWEEKINALLEK